VSTRDQSEPLASGSPAEPVERIVTSVGREAARLAMRREDELTGSLAPFRVGSVSYLNAVPLTRGIEDQVQFHTPAKLAEFLHADQLDAALVSITEVLFHDRYDVLDGIAVASLGEVFSVFLAHRRPLEETEVIWLDPASCTSVNLLRVLLAERGLKPEFRALTDYAAAPSLDAVLLIGNPAIEFRRANHPHAIWDLGTAWQELTGLPFVYAVWALRRDLDTASLRRRLREAKALGLDTLDAIIAARREYDADFRRDYLEWHIHYHLTDDEKRGVARFVELLRQHQERPVFAPRFVV
jgi:predicted solute-binding protein